MDKALGLFSYAVTIAVPLISLPLLGNRLNHSDLGMYFVLISLSTLLSVVVDFGYTISGFAESKYGMIDREILSMKASRLSGSIIALFVVLLYGYFANMNALDILCSLMLSVLMGYNNIWYFQVIRNLKIFYVSEIVGKLAFLAVFFYYQSYIISYESAILIYLCGLLISHVVLLIKYPMLYGLINAEEYIRIIKTLKLSGLFTRLIINTYVNANTVVLNFFLPPQSIAGYGAAERIFRAVSGIATPFYNSKIIHLKSLRETDRLSAVKNLLLDLLYIFICGSLGSIALILSIDPIIKLLFKSAPSGFFDNMRILSIVIPFAICNGYAGLRWMIVDGQEKLFTCFISIAAVINVLSVIYMVVLNYKYYGLGLLFGEVFLFTCLAIKIARSLYEETNKQQ